jgi:hypothetical protein
MGEPFRTVLQALERCQLAMVMLAARVDKQRKQELLDLRRVLASCLIDLQQSATHAGAPFANGPLADEFLSRFDEVRFAVANHQSSWPVLRIDDFPQEYRKSSDFTSALIQGFTGWIRAALDTRP